MVAVVRDGGWFLVGGRWIGWVWGWVVDGSRNTCLVAVALAARGGGGAAGWWVVAAWRRWFWALVAGAAGGEGGWCW